MRILPEVKKNNIQIQIKEDTCSLNSSVFHLKTNKGIEVNQFEKKTKLKALPFTVLQGGPYTRVFNDGLTERGKFIDGEFISGIRYYPSGGIDSGEFENGVLNCNEGVRIFPNNNTYIGVFFRNKFISGVQKFSNGITRLGYFNDNEIYYGTVYYPTGGMDKGTFYNGDLDGAQCERHYPDGGIDMGNFLAGKLHGGRGIRIYANRGVDKGTFVNGLLHGNHSFRKFPDGTTYDGEFKNDHFISGTKYISEGKSCSIKVFDCESKNISSLNQDQNKLDFVVIGLFFYGVIGLFVFSFIRCR